MFLKLCPHAAVANGHSQAQHVSVDYITSEMDSREWEILRTFFVISLLFVQLKKHIYLSVSKSGHLKQHQQMISKMFSL